MWDYMLLKNDDYAVDHAISQLKVAIGFMHRANTDSLDKLAICISPSSCRACTATSAFKAGELHLAPVSTTFGVTNSLVPKDSKVPDSACDTSTALTQSNGRTSVLYISPKQPVKASLEGQKAVHEFIVPFWVVQSTQDVDAANMHIQRVSVVICLLYTSPSTRDQRGARMPSSA